MTLPSAVVVGVRSAAVAQAQVGVENEEVGRLLGGAKEKALVLYCNGPFCVME